MATVSRITAGSHGKNKVSVLGPPRPCCHPQASARALVSPLENKQTAKENLLKLLHCPPPPTPTPTLLATKADPLKLCTCSQRSQGKVAHFLLFTVAFHQTPQYAPSPTPGLPCPPFLFCWGEKRKRGEITKRWLCAPGGVERAGARSVICKQKAAIV